MNSQIHKNNSPLVSVLIPTHERPHYFSLALASVVNQTYKNIEIIVSDNSYDNETELIVNDFQGKFGNIKYIHSPGIDIEHNWQMCWDNMSPQSEYINFLMDDDIFAPSKIEEMVNYFLKYPQLALVTSYRKLIDKNGNLLPDLGFNSPVAEEDTLVTGEVAGNQIVKNCTNWIGEPTTVLFKKEYTDGIFRGWTGDEKYLILDYPLWLRLLERGDMVYIAKPLSYFRQHEDNGFKEFYTSNILGPLSLATMIQNSWNRKKFLTSTEDLRKAIFTWCRTTIYNIQNCYEQNYSESDFDDLLHVYNVMTNCYISKEPSDIVF